MQIEDIVAKFSTGIFVWYNFKENAAILYLYSINKDKEIESFLKNKGNVTLCKKEMKILMMLKNLITLLVLMF